LQKGAMGRKGFKLYGDICEAGGSVEIGRVVSNRRSVGEGGVPVGVRF
jgi:hypothetical protein